MGGVAESTVQKPKKSNKSTEIVQSEEKESLDFGAKGRLLLNPSNQEIRMHVSGSEIHFHDDAAGIKVAVPVAMYWRMIGSLSNRTEHFVSYRDIKRNTSVEIHTGMHGKEFEASIRIQEHNEPIGNTFQALERLIDVKL